MAALAVLSVVMAFGGQRVGAQSQWTPVALWNLDEPVGSTRLVDASGNGLTAPIGTKVQLGVRDGGATVQSFPYISTTAPAAPAERLHVVGDKAALDPGTQGFSVEVRFRTHAGNRNVLQKGQSGTPGGYWKMEISGGVATCVFRGSTGSVGMKSTSSVEDDRWHVVRCVRYPGGGAELYFDGVRQARSGTLSGTIDNSSMMVIGGKYNCDNVTTSCDYFHGRIDYVRIERSSTASPTTTTTTRPTTTTTTSSTTTTVRPTTTTTTTTTTTVPPVRLPAGRLEQVAVDGRTITAIGTAGDPDGEPTVRVSSTWNGRTATAQGSSVDGRFRVPVVVEAGEHTVCATALDVPTGASVALGCSNVVVK